MYTQSEPNHFNEDLCFGLWKVWLLYAAPIGSLPYEATMKDNNGNNAETSKMIESNFTFCLLSQKYLITLQGLRTRQEAVNVQNWSLSNPHVPICRHSSKPPESNDQLPSGAMIGRALQIGNI